MRYQLGDIYIDFEEGYTEDFKTNSTIKLFWLLFESIIWLRDIWYFQIVVLYESNLSQKINVWKINFGLGT